TFDSLMRDLSRLTAASLWAEVALKSYAAGETSDMLFRLFLGSLQMLDTAQTRDVPYVTIQFLWRFLSLAGYQPAADSCCACGAILRGKHAVVTETNHGFLCSSCAPQGGHSVPPGALRYLEATGQLPLSQAALVTLEPAGLRSLRHALPTMVQAVLEGELVTLRSAGAVP
ncbi:MAG TPA: DNA repair protein RecO C-terminal domain-containing protein, partial [Spirochaetia bacterium]|nr:DNA repair protein RecO C-terminal domain-containing protein [Spirochaetia bacterium]